jgi:hypothetical protein
MLQGKPTNRTTKLFQGFSRMPLRSTIAIAAFCLLTAPSFAQYQDYVQPSFQSQTLKGRDIPSWMTLDMELRGRTEAQTSISYMSGNSQVYELTRVHGGMELRPTHWLTGYVQFRDAHVLGLPLAYTAPTMSDTFDFRQAYLAVHVRQVSFTAGRQELKFGDERLVGTADWLNAEHVFDGFDMHIGNKDHLDLFSASIVDIHPTSLDMHAGGLNFHGAYGSINTWLPRTTLEPYAFIKAMPYVVSQQNTGGTETEMTTGLRVAGNAPAGFDYVAEGALQRGNYSNDSIHAGAAYVKAGYTAAHIPWKPRLQGEYDYATGNPHRNPDRIGTFDQLYPSPHNVFGLVDLFAWENIKQARANLNLHPLSNLTVTLQQGFMSVANTRDGVYNGTGAEFLKPPVTMGVFASDSIGREFDASMKYVLHNHILVQSGVGHFSPGALMTANAHGAPLTISYLSFTYRFKMDQ